eukprot:10456877-Heterocapsa_arctica.AAC.1
MGVLPCWGNMLNLPGVFNHHSHPSQVLTFEDRAHSWGEDGVKTLPRRRALGPPDLLPCESGLLEQEH